MSEIQEPNDTGFSFDAYTKEKIKSTARIAGIVAIVFLASSVLDIFQYFFYKNANTVSKKEGFNEPSLQQLANTSSVFALIVGILISLVSAYFLYSFFVNSKQGIAYSEGAKFDTGLKNLGNFFKLWAILITFFMVIIFLSALAAGMGLSFN